MICPNLNALAIGNIHSRFIQIKYDKEEVTLVGSFGAIEVIEVTGDFASRFVRRAERSRRRTSRIRGRA
jgi:hypothetical protein